MSNGKSLEFWRKQMANLLIRDQRQADRDANKGYPTYDRQVDVFVRSLNVIESGITNPLYRQWWNGKPENDKREFVETCIQEFVQRFN